MALPAGSAPLEHECHSGETWRKIEEKLMDHIRFDVLARSVGAHPSRRGLLQSLAGIGLAVLTHAAFGADTVDARKKNNKGKKKKNGKNG
jgi:hypothetical protein